MNDITKHLLTRLYPWVIGFILGLIVAWKGCGTPLDPTEVVEVEKPVYKVQYIDRWKTDTVRFVKTRIKYDTLNVDRWNERIVSETLYVVDTLKIVEAWLTELVKYDTTFDFSTANVRVKWQNYQNLSEQLLVEVKPKPVESKFTLGVHGNVGLLTDFQSDAKPLFGVGLHSSIKKTYFGLDYGFNGDHYVGMRIGKTIITK